MKYETPRLTALAQATKAISVELKMMDKIITDPRRDLNLISNEIQAGAYEDWE